MKIYKQIIECMRDMKAIEKDQVNKSQGFKFRGIDQVYNALNPILAKNGVFTVPTVLTVKNETKITAKGTEMTHVFMEMEYKFFADDGSFVTAVVHGEALDTGDKAMNKAMSIAHKYAFFQVFAIPTAEEKDPDFESHEVMPNYKQMFINKAKEVAGGNENALQQIKSKYGLNTVQDWSKPQEFFKKCFDEISVLS